MQRTPASHPGRRGRGLGPPATQHAASSRAKTSAAARPPPSGRARPEGRCSSPRGTRGGSGRACARRRPRAATRATTRVSAWSRRATPARGVDERRAAPVERRRADREHGRRQQRAQPQRARRPAADRVGHLDEEALVGALAKTRTRRVAQAPTSSSSSSIVSAAAGRCGRRRRGTRRETNNRARPTRARGREPHEARGRRRPQRHARVADGFARGLSVGDARQDACDLPPPLIWLATASVAPQCA